ncbi:La-related protein 6C [Linum perenne]
MAQLPQPEKKKISDHNHNHESSSSSLITTAMMKENAKPPPTTPTAVAEISGCMAISVIASTKKMKSLTSNHHLITQALKSSSKLVVNEDGRKVKRKIPFTEKDREELQSRTVVVENLPDDHSHQNLEKIFGVVGSVKTIRICHPQESNSSRSKSDFFMSNKLHALVEFEAPDVAEKAVEKLNDERNWRKGLRVRLLFRCSPKSVLKSRKSEFDGIMDDEEGPLSESLDDISIPSITDITSEPNPDETPGSSKKGGSTARGGRGPKGRGRLQSYGSGGRGLLLSPSTQTVSSSSPFEGGSSGKTYGGFNRGPRMPDGTRGFTMGRGKPLALASPAVAMVE